MKYFLLILFLFAYPFICSATIVEFNITNKIKASVSLEDNKKIEYQIINSDNLKRKGSFSVDTENIIRVTHDDYNFDGKEDFAIWYTDDGMGTYDIYRVFIYVEKVDDFKEIKPACGDDFMNLTLNKKRRELISMYYADNEPQRCITNSRWVTTRP
ncbi:hypothetical protein DPB93_17910 [Salmonella enterica subsp. salamae]|nr:hypothetical protein [Salmonella enterica subsp. salamae]ECI4077497.1 hypothetical protein [Salmonella enterica subsp. salamae]HCL5251528.1 hypothetical protein [Salmonella enterica]